MPKEIDNQPHWYVADVNPKFEKKLIAILAKDGIEYFTPVQKTVDISGKKPKVISTPLSPGLVYFHCTESQRRDILQYGSFIRQFVGNGKGGPKIIADSDMNEYIHQLDIRNEA